jgi:hypothetical protein
VILFLFDRFASPFFQSVPVIFYLNKTVVVTGKLTQGFTVHHKTAILIDVLDIKLTE